MWGDTMKNKRKEYLIIPVANIKSRDNITEDLSPIFDKNYISKRHQK